MASMKGIDWQGHDLELPPPGPGGGAQRMRRLRMAPARRSGTSRAGQWPTSGQVSTSVPGRSSPRRLAISGGETGSCSPHSKVIEPEKEMRPAAQRSWDDRARVNIGGGAQLGTNRLSESISLTKNVEATPLTADLQKSAVPFFDGGVDFRLVGNLGVGAAVSFLTGKADANVSAAIPHPFFFNKAVEAKNVPEIIRIGKAVLARDPDNLDYLSALVVQIRTLELFGNPPNFAHAADAAEFAEHAIRLIEAGKVPTPQQSSQKRKGKETLAEEPKKKKTKPFGPLPKASNDLKIGGQDDLPQTTPHRSTRSVATATQPSAQAKSRTWASPCRALPPSSMPGPTAQLTQTQSSGPTLAPKAP